MLKPKTIYRAENYIFNNGTSKAKFFVILVTDEDNILLLSLTTSKSKLPVKYEISQGCAHFDNQDGYGHSYIWNENQIIGKKGFAFPLKTYLQLEFKSQLIEITGDLLKANHVTKQVIECDELIDTEYITLLNCLLKSRYLKRKYFTIIQKIISS